MEKKKKKTDTSMEVPRWENLDRDILTVIFKKLHLMDLTNGASRVCVWWFLVSHDKSLWQTVDMAKLQHVVVSYRPKLGDKIRRPVVFYNHRVEHGISSRNPLARTFCKIEQCKNLRKLLIEITRLSGSVTKNLIFNYLSYIKKKDLLLAAQRMPNIEKLVLPRWCYQTENSCRFAFSQWKNLKTLIIAHDHNVTGEFEFRAVGETCSNLTNFKFLGYVGIHNAELMLKYFKNLKRLSLRCSYANGGAVFTLIIGLQDRNAILNVTHCAMQIFDLFPDMDHETNDAPNLYLVPSAMKKLEKYITCRPNDCSFCKGWFERFQLTSLDASPWHPYDEDWHYDEIEEFVF